MKFIFFLSFLLLLFVKGEAFGAMELSPEGRPISSEGVTAVDANASEGEKNNQLATSICQLILLLNGRTGRAVAVIAVFALAFLFMLGKLQITLFLTFIAGMALLFGAKSIALVMLPSYVKVKETDRGLVKKSPDELVKQVCPELK
jgi:type IV secretory pathway VirB2 component (pilin)